MGRAKKDAIILDMAMEQKKKIEESKKTGCSKTYSNSGGFVGIDQLTKGRQSNFTTKKSKSSQNSEDPPTVPTQDSEMFILGLLKEQRQEAVYKERVNMISEESLGCVGDENSQKTFGN